MSAEDLVRFAFPELADPEPCSCDEALALRAKLDEANAQLKLRIIQHDTVEAELRRRIINQGASLGYPRLEDVVEIQRLKGELARTRFLSVVRGRLCEAWAKMLDEKRAELAGEQTALRICRTEIAEANNRWHSACDVGRRLDVRNADLRGALDEAEVKIDEATAREVSLVNAANQLSRELAEAKRAAETWEELAHGQEVLGKQADALVERFKALALDATAKMNAMEVSMNAAFTERDRVVARLTELTAALP